MPGNLLFSDKTFPNDPKDIKAILNYLYMLQEELRYTMGNMSGDNFNDAGLTDLSNIITHDLSITVQNVTDSVDVVAGSVNIWSRGLTAVPLNGYAYRLQITDSGIFATKFQNIAGTPTVIDTTALYS